MKFWIRDFVAYMYMLFCRIHPLNQKRFVFKSDRGGGCTDSPFALFETLREQYPEYDAIWILKDTSKKPKGAQAVKEGSFAEIKALATSKYWVDNKRKGCWTVKRKGQKYIQTWHGPIALKKVEKDIQDKLPPYYVKSAKHDSKIADYFLSASRWTTGFYRESFWYDGEILEFGIPRSDILFRDSTDIKNKIYKKYNLQNSTKLVLYAPTFRDDGRTDVYRLDYHKVLNALQERFGQNWKIIVRLHPNMKDVSGIVSFDEDVLNGNLVEDIGDLIMASDMLITDYSSCMFDAMEAGKTVIIFATDIELYTKDRGFAIPMDKLPFEICRDNTEIENIILTFDKKKYEEKVQQFTEDIGIFDDGNASSNVLKYVLGNEDD